MINHKKIIIILVVAGVLILLGGAVYVLNSRLATGNLNLYNPNQTQDQNQANSTDSMDLIVSKKDDTSYNVSISSKTPKTLSAFSIRLTYPSGSDFSSQIFTPNPDLIADGWVFPVRTIAQDENSNMINVDISGINPTVEGYILSQDVVLGTLDNFPPLTFTVDKSQTKIIEKSGNELNYIFKQQ